MKTKQEVAWRDRADELLQALQSSNSREKYLTAIVALIDRYEIEGQKSFKKDFSCGLDGNETRAILKNLHQHSIISVSSDIACTDPKPNAPSAVLAHSILEDPSIADSSWTDISVEIDALRYLQSKLQSNSTGSKDVYSCGKLSVNFDAGTLKFGRKTPIEISPSIRELRFLRLLMSRSGEVVTYSEFARELGLQTSTHRKNYAPDIQIIRRDLVNKVLKVAGMQDKDIEQMICNKRGIGYVLRCPK